MITSDPIANEAIDEIAKLLATAYRRYIAANPLDAPSQAVNGELDNSRATSPHVR